MTHNQTFDIHGEEYANVAVNMLRLSQGECHLLGDNDEYVSATQLDVEVNQENMEAIVSQEPHTYYVEHIQNDIVELNMIEGC
jgi:hypothetical protein